MHCQKDLVPVSHELAFGGEALERLALELRRVAIDVVEDTDIEDEKRPIDPLARVLDLLLECDDAVAGQDEASKAPRRMDRG